MRGSIGVEYGSTCLGNGLFLRRWRFRGGDVEILAYRAKGFHQIMALQKYNQHAFLDQDNDSEKGLNKTRSQNEEFSKVGQVEDKTLGSFLYVITSPIGDLASKDWYIAPIEDWFTMTRLSPICPR
jgi:hypothetical protein